MQPPPEQLIVGSPESLLFTERHGRGAAAVTDLATQSGTDTTHEQSSPDDRHYARRGSTWDSGPVPPNWNIHAQQLNKTQPLGRDGDLYMTNPVLNTTAATSREVSHGRFVLYHQHD